MGCEFKPQRGLVQGVQTIFLTLVDLNPKQVASDARGPIYIKGLAWSRWCTINDLKMHCQVNEDKPHQHQRTFV